MFNVNAKYIQLKNHLKEMIHSGKLQENEKILSERDMAQEYGLSIATVNKAVSALVNEGVLYRKPKKGTFVNAGTLPDTMKNIFILGYGIGDTHRFFKTMSQIAYPPYIRKDYSFIIKTFPDKFSNPELFIDELQKISNILKINVVIILAASMNVDIMEKCKNIKIPLLFLGDFNDKRCEKFKYDQLTGDNACHSQKGIKHLCNTGHKNIAFFSYSTNYKYNMTAWKAAQKTAEEEGVSITLFEVPMRHTEKEVLDSFVSKRNSFDSVFLSGFHSPHFMEAMKSAGIRIPAEISVLSSSENNENLSFIKFENEVFFNHIYSRMEHLILGKIFKTKKKAVKISIEIIEKGSINVQKS